MGRGQVARLALGLFLLAAPARAREPGACAEGSVKAKNGGTTQCVGVIDFLLGDLGVTFTAGKAVVAQDGTVSKLGACVGDVATEFCASTDMSGRIFDAGTATLIGPHSTTLPATCTVGERYVDSDATATARAYTCEATNSWVQEGNILSLGRAGGQTIIGGTGDTDVLTLNGNDGTEMSGIIMHDTVTGLPNSALTVALALPLANLDINSSIEVLTGLGVGVNKTGGQQTWNISADTALQGATLFWFYPKIQSSPASTTRTTGSWAGLSYAPNFRLNAASGSPVFTINSSRVVVDTPTYDRSASSGTIVAAESTAVFSEPVIGASGTITDRYGLWFKNKSAGGSGAQTNAIAVNVGDQTVGTLAAAVGSAMAQGSGKWLLYQTAYADSVHLGGMRLGGTTATQPDTILHLVANGGSTVRRAAVTFDEDSTTPGNPTSSVQMRVYMKADKFVIQFNDAGTVRYKTLDLTGTGVTWAHSTSAP